MSVFLREQGFQSFMIVVMEADGVYSFENSG